MVGDVELFVVPEGLAEGAELWRDAPVQAARAISAHETSRAVVACTLRIPFVSVLLDGRRSDALILNHMVQSQILNRTFSALSDPTRRDILERLARGPTSISELAKPIGISLPAVLKHVRILEETNLVTTQKHGRTRECRLGTEQMADATEWIDEYRRHWEPRLDRLGECLEKSQKGASP